VPGRTMKKPPLRPTDIPEKVLAMNAKIIGISTIELIDGLQFRGDNVFFPVPWDEVGLAWIWSRGDEEDAEDDEKLELDEQDDDELELIVSGNWARIRNNGPDD
jgi:hypothetical protein